MGEIYKIECIPTKMIYIGQVVSYMKNGKKRGYKNRWKDHIRETKRNGKKECTYLNNAIRKYGDENFEISLIYTTKCIKELDNLEIKYIKEYNSLSPNGFNLTKGGKGCRANEESRRKMSNKKNHLKRKIIVWNNNGFEKKYDSIANASKDLGFTTGSISRSCRIGYISGKINSVKYYSRFEEENDMSKFDIKKHPNRTLSDEIAKNIYLYYHSGTMNKTQIKNMYNVSYCTISGIITKKHYKNATCVVAGNP